MYFEKPGAENTQKTVGLALQAARENEICNIVVASGTGETALLLVDAAKSGMNIAVVTHCCGYKTPGEQELSLETRKILESCGMKIVTAAHVLSGAERGISRKFTGAYPVEIMAHTLRMFGQGTKVCVECSVMALDNGAISPAPVVAIAGSGRGADTAWILRPAGAADILNTRLDKLICKPVL